MQVMILAAGRSTRLGTLGTVIPKPLVPLCGYPAISFGLALCRAAGLEDVVVNVHHLHELVRESLGNGSRFGLSIRYSVEEELLGTGGGIRNARPFFRSEPILVMNGKVVTAVDLLGEVIAAHRAATPGTLATMVVRDDPHPERWAPVGIDATGAVVSIRGVRTDRTPVGPIVERMFTGIHIMEPALLDRLPPGVSDVIADAYLPALLDGGRIQSVKMKGYFAEHSTPESYLEGNLALLRIPALIAHPPGPLVGVDAGARIHSTAQVISPVRIADGAIIEEAAVVGPEAVICGGARVASGARLEQAVVLPGATASGVHKRGVITP